MRGIGISIKIFTAPVCDVNWGVSVTNIALWNIIKLFLANIIPLILIPDVAQMYETNIDSFHAETVE